MIISHKYKFIFIKTKKTAGTSIEIALSQHLGENDIITPITPADEEIRQQKNGLGPQHYLETSFWKHNPRDWLRRFRRGKLKHRFFNHIDANLVKKRIGDEIWNSYKKITVERNPWDKVVSLYHYQSRLGETLDFDDFIDQGKHKTVIDFDRYSINGTIDMDTICEYRSLNDDLAEFAREIGLPALDLPHAKGGFRKEGDHYSKLYSEKTRAIIEKDFSREINHFRYVFEA